MRALAVRAGDRILPTFWCRRAAFLVAHLLIWASFAATTTGQGQDKERAYIHWPPDGSRVSRESLSAAGIRVEFSGLKSYPHSYRASFTVAFGNSTTVSTQPYGIDSNRIHPLSSPSSGFGVDLEQLNRGLVTPDGTIRSLVTPNGTAARLLIPYPAAFSWDSTSHLMDDALEHDPVGICEESDLEEHVTLSIRLHRGWADEDDPTRMKQWSNAAAEASISIRLLVRYGEISAFGSSDQDDGSVEGEVMNCVLCTTPAMPPRPSTVRPRASSMNSAPHFLHPTHYTSLPSKTWQIDHSAQPNLGSSSLGSQPSIQARSERIVLADFMQPPRQLFTALSLAKAGFTAVIRGLHNFASYTVTLKLDDTPIFSERLLPSSGKYFHFPDPDGDGEPAWLRGMRCDGTGNRKHSLWPTGREKRFHAHLPLLSQGSHRARMEVRSIPRTGSTQPLSLQYPSEAASNPNTSVTLNCGAQG